MQMAFDSAGGLVILESRSTVPANPRARPHVALRRLAGCDIAAPSAICIGCLQQFDIDPRLPADQLCPSCEHDAYFELETEGNYVLTDKHLFIAEDKSDRPEDEPRSSASEWPLDEDFKDA
jgi:hypothetical protein